MTNLTYGTLATRIGALTVSETLTLDAIVNRFGQPGDGATVTIATNFDLVHPQTADTAEYTVTVTYAEDGFVLARTFTACGYAAEFVDNEFRVYALSDLTSNRSDNG